MIEPGASHGPRAAKPARQAARAVVAAYHQQELGRLLDHVRDGFVQLDAGEIDEFELDDPGDTVLVDDEVSDERIVHTGLRQVSLRNWTLAVNGERLFVKGANLGPTRAALAEATPTELARDVELAHRARVRARGARPHHRVRLPRALSSARHCVPGRAHHAG